VPSELTAPARVAHRRCPNGDRVPTVAAAFGASPEVSPVIVTKIV
jgi:hypothetical protein